MVLVVVMPAMRCPAAMPCNALQRLLLILQDLFQLLLHLGLVENTIPSMSTSSSSGST